MKRLFIIYLLCSLLFIQGCLPLLVAAAGYVMSTEKKSTTELKKAYNSYLQFMEEINLERNKVRLEPKPILTYREWMKGVK